MATTPQQPRNPRHATLRSALGLGGAPLAWTLQVLVSETLSAHACFPVDTPRATPLGGTALVTALWIVCALSILGGLGCWVVAWRDWRTLRRPDARQSGGPADRSMERMRFLAKCGLAVSTGFVIAQVFSVCALWLVAPCSPWAASDTPPAALRLPAPAIAAAFNGAGAQGVPASAAAPTGSSEVTPTSGSAVTPANDSTTTPQAGTAANIASADAALITRGAYLAKAGDCAACHDGRNGSKFAGGLAINSPFGPIYGSNITPDTRYGIGSFSYRDFDDALRRGVVRGKRLYPAMPYPSFAKLTDDDVRALYEYFMHGVAPVANQPPRTTLPFPFSQRWGLYFWDLAFARGTRYEPQPRQDAQWNRGAYLVQGLGHCGSCHTPRGPAYNERALTEAEPLYLTGGVNDHWSAPNLSGDPGSGLGRWSEAELSAFLRSGHGAGATAFGAMAPVIGDSLQYLSDSDLQAIAHYLKSLPAHQSSGTYHPAAPARQQTVASAVPDRPLELPGAGIYAGYCAKCHQANGQGVPDKYPRLAGNALVLGADTTSIARLVIAGSRSPATATGPRPRSMPAFGHKLSDAEIAQVLSFVRSAWGNGARPVSTRDVGSIRRAIHY